MRTDPPFRSAQDRARARLAAALALGLVLAFAFWLRRSTFHLPHSRGDQAHYVGLAHKLATRGMRDYNLRGLDARPTPGAEAFHVFVDVPGRGPLVDALVRQGDTYYDVQLFQTPYGFPWMLVGAHALVSPDAGFGFLHVDDRPLIARAPPGEGLARFRFPPGLARRQLYAVIVPLVASLALVALTFALGRALYDSLPVATVAGLLVAASPIDVLAAQRVWADDPTAAAALGAALVFVAASRRPPGGARAALALGAGVLLGVALVTKHTAGCVGLALCAWRLGVLLAARARLRAVLFDPLVWLFGLAALAVSGHWFAAMAREHGNPLHLASRAFAERSDYRRLVEGRPGWVYALGIPFQNPLMALAYLAPLVAALDRARRSATWLLVLWIAAHLVVFATVFAAGAKEERYMLPAYPAYAVLAARALELVRQALAARLGPLAASGVVGAAVLGSCAFSAALGREAVRLNWSLILWPW